VSDRQSNRYEPAGFADAQSVTISARHRDLLGKYSAAFSNLVWRNSRSEALSNVSWIVDPSIA
jgi:hypothetical protein